MQRRVSDNFVLQNNLLKCSFLFYDFVRFRSVTCGLLQCTHKNERLEFGMETVSVVAHQFLPDPVASIPCRTVNVDLGLNEIDPGLTPDGAYCGVNKV